MTGRPAGPGTEPPASRDGEPGGPPTAQPGGLVLSAVVVVIFLLISFFTSISGKPLDGMLMLAVAAGLAWDAGRRRRARAHTGPAGGALAGAADSHPQRGSRWLAAAAWVAGGIVYAVAVGSFTRYSWPATIAVVGLGVPVVALGWRGPLRAHPDRGPLPVAGTAVWGGVLVAGGLWELSALFQQPTLTTGSYAHPTISTLTDPLLASTPGRSLVLAAWLALGWYLVRR